MKSIIPHGSEQNGTLWRACTEDGREAGVKIRLASAFFSRMRGLLGTKSLLPGEGLLLVPCNSVHMFFMKYALDIVFLDDAGRIVAIEPCLRPWRVSRLQPEALAVLELPAGACATAALKKGDQLFFIPYINN